jgi:hypothetical protein
MRLLFLGLVSLGLAALGVRLVRLSRRTGASPERWLGLAFLLAGASAWLLPLAASQELRLGAETARGIAFVAQGGMTGALVCLVLFTWQVFRAGSAMGRRFALALIAANVATGVAMLLAATPVPVGGVGLAVIVVRCVSLLWLFLESALHAQRMRRRVRLGLGDPIVANRFTLWSIWTGALACIPLFVLALRATGVLVEPVPGEPLPVALRAILVVLAAGGGAAVAAGWLAFFPPASYRRWITARAAASS